MAPAGWDEVLGGGAADEAPRSEGGGVDDGDSDGGEPPARDKRVKTSTKVVLVVAGWLLLTLFLVGQFSSDKPQPSAVARLDTVAGGDGAPGEEEEAFEPEPVDTEDEELLDADGDGFLSAAEQGINEGEAAASAERGSGGGAASTSSGAYDATPSESPTGANAVPGAAPPSGSGGLVSDGSTSTTARSGTTTTTTVKSSSTTSAPGSTSSTSSSTSTSIATGSEATIAIRGPGLDVTSHGSFEPGNLVVPKGTKVRVHNQDTKGHGWDLPGNHSEDVAANGYSAPVTINSTVEFKCSVHAQMRGKITVE